ncbi:MAG: Ig-like domain-containing protein, partial [Candidatus Thiodiazotropha sp.]
MRRRRSKKRSNALICEELEPRLLLSADLVGIAFDPASNDAEQHDKTNLLTIEAALQSVPQNQIEESDSSTRELVIIDPATPDYQSLVDDLISSNGDGRNFEIVLLDTTGNGIDQLSETLTEYRGLDAIHLISHGGEGGIRLGDATLDLEALQQSADRIAAWGEALSAGGDWLIYGCDIASTVSGEDFIEQFADLTGADVAASDDTTGHDSSGGDWQLEYRTGSVETAIAFSRPLQSSWGGSLDITTGLVGHYTFDEGSGTTAIDSSVTGNHGTLFDGPVYTAGQVGSHALSFNGNFDRVEAPDSTATDFGTFDFSVGFWFNSTYSGPQARLVGDMAVGGGAGYIFYTDGLNDLNLQVSSGAESIILTAEGLFDGTWHHVMGIRSGPNYTLYVDGHEADQWLGSAIGVIDNSQPLRIGASSSYGDYDGLIDEVRLYDRALSADDAIELFTDGGGIVSYPTSYGMDNSLEWISNVSFAGIDNTTGQEAWDGYGDYTGQTATIERGTSSTLSVTINPQFNEYVNAWIDWNQDNDFNDPGEAYTLATNTSSPGPHTLSITAPLDAVTGTTVMRVSLQYAGSPSPGEIMSYGEVEDYSINVTGNTDPVITSNGGGASANVNVGENSTTVTTVTATDADLDTLSYSIDPASVDADKFTINRSSGVLTFIAAPDFENPTDSGSDNIYDVQVQVSDGNGGVDIQAISVTVDNVNEAPTFDVPNGVVVFANGADDEHSTSAVVQADGKLIVVGEVNNDYLVIRYNTDGTLDTGFGASGVVTLDLTAVDEANVVTLQADGKILVGGYAGGDWGIVRLNTDGSLDAGFGAGGIALINNQTAYNVYDLVVQPDGKILVAGDSDVDSAIGRLNADGTLDSSFGTNGITLFDHSGATTDQGRKIELQSDGSILVASAYFNGSWQGDIRRFDSNGAADTSFGSSGSISFNVNAGSDLIVNPDDSFVVTMTSSNFILTKWTADGTLDTGFGSGGVATLDMGGTEVATEIARQSDGKYVVSGYSIISGSDYITVARFNADGTPDTSFAGTGYVVTDAIIDNVGTEGGLAIGDDGSIYVTGTRAGSADDVVTVSLTSSGAYNTASSLDGNPTFVEGGAAVVLDANVEVFDAELSAIDNFNGATLTLERELGANAEDIFSATGTLGTLTESGNLVVGATTIGSVTTNSGGTLVLSFNANATNALVNSAMQQIVYSNTSDAPPVSVQIAWTFDDGNSGAQGGGGALQATGNTTVFITAVNSDPVITSDGGIAAAGVGIDENTTAVTTVTATDVELDTLTYTINPASADADKFAINGSTGELIFVAAPDYENPTDANTDNVYEVTVEVDDGNGGVDTQALSVTVLNISEETPVANADSISVAEGGTATTLDGGFSTVLNNDTGLGDTPVTVSLVTDVTNGSLTLNGDGTFSYTHDGSENFTDSFTYRVTDNDGETADATVTINVTPVSDATPVANADTIIVAEGGTTTLLDGGFTTVLNNDTGLGDTPVTVSLVTDVTNGSLTLNGDGTFSYTHDGSENFTDSFTYRVTDNDGETADATVTINVTPVSDQTPVANADSISVAEGGTATTLDGGFSTVLNNDTGLGDTPVTVSLVTDVTNGSLTLNGDGTFSYTHDGSENFTDSFTYRVTDNDGETADATVTINVTPVSDATPVANADSISVAEGGTATTLDGGFSTVLNNDTGLGDTPVTVSLITDVTNGTLTLNSDGTFSYTHDGSENFTDSFTYRITDNDGETADATVTINVTPVSDATPVANADSISVAEGGTATTLDGGFSTVLNNDTGLGDTPVTVSLITDVTNGSLTLNGDGTFSYTHDGSENFTDSFTYRVTDNDGETADATVTINVTPVSDATPVANADSISVAEG